jgi:hypothetical protein
MNSEVWCKLPEELLDAIVVTAVAQSQTDAAVLVRCSSQWQKRIQPQLYLDPCLWGDRIKNFHDTVKANPALRVYPRGLRLSTPSLSETQIGAIHNVLKLCTTIKRLYFVASEACFPSALAASWASLGEALQELDIVSGTARIFNTRGIVEEARYVWFTRPTLIGGYLFPTPIPKCLALPIDARKDVTNFHRLLVDFPSRLRPENIVVLNIVYPPMGRDVQCQISCERALNRLSYSPFCLIVRHSIDDQTIWEPLFVMDPRSLWHWAASKGKIYGRIPVWD